MKFNFNDVTNCINKSDFSGDSQEWFKQVWNLIDKNNLNHFNTIVEKLGVYCRIFGMCAVYAIVSDILQDGDGEYYDINLKIDYEQLINIDLTDEIDFVDDEGYPCNEIIESYIKNVIIYREENIYEILNLLKKELGLSSTFVSIYFTLNYEDFLYRDYDDINFSYDFEGIYYKIVNDLNDNGINKLRAFEWLEQNM